MEDLITLIHYNGKIERIYLGNSEEVVTIGELSDYIQTMPRENKIISEVLSGGDEIPDIIHLKHSNMEQDASE